MHPAPASAALTDWLRGPGSTQTALAHARSERDVPTAQQLGAIPESHWLLPDERRRVLRPAHGIKGSP